MARNCDELFNPATGLRTVFRQTAEETNGELPQVDWIAEGPWTTGPDHIHRLQDERFEVVSGRLGLRVNGVEHELEAGGALEAPAGAPHAAWNAGSGEVHALVDFRRARPGTPCGSHSSCATSRTRSTWRGRRSLFSAC